MNYLYVDPALRHGGVLYDPRLPQFTERHHFRLPPIELAEIGAVERHIDNGETLGVIFGLGSGLPTKRSLALARYALRHRKSAFLYWPTEDAIEVLDRERIGSFHRHRLAYIMGMRLLTWRQRHAQRAAKKYRKTLHAFAGTILPVSFPKLTAAPSVANKIPGKGVYIRTDYWAQLISGGSYGHTCYVAHELARVTDDFVCLLGSRFPLLDELGVAQEVVRPPLRTSTATDLLQANSYYYEALRGRLGKLRPVYVFERLVLGNYAVAQICRELEIPYLVEYNGSELSMRHSFDADAGAMDHEDLFTEAERAAFEQATAITAISDHVRDDIVRRGIRGDKIVVNPNGVDCSEYAPPTAEEKRDLRAAFGFAPEHRVIGFIGTFGGWHGIDVLAAAIPEICRRAPEARFLLIGDGNLKHLVTDAVRRNSLERQVVDVGRTDQRLGARYMRAADIFVSPHASHMRDSKFFGSPTKLFEYMALGGGIVASDLEQIGITLAPALRPADFACGPPKVGLERAVLCKPGDVDEFVAGVLALVCHANVAAALGANARAAAQEYFSWERHVARIWDHVLGLKRERAWH